MKFTKFFFICVSSFLIFSILPVYAYGGPGVAFGALIVMFTVVLASIASFFLLARKYLNKAFSNLFKRNKQKIENEMPKNNKKLK